MATDRRPLSDDQLLAAIDAAEADALGPVQGDIAADRADAIDRYLGKAYGDEQKGRSSVVSRDVSDVVEGVLANVLKPFVSGERIVQFNPRGPEDEARAQQETDYVNFITLERNNGFLVLNAAVKDALLLRNGYIKCGWTKRDDVVIETYVGLSDDELGMLMQDTDVEVAEHTEYPDPEFVAPPPMPAPPMPAPPMPGQMPGTATMPPPGAAPQAPPAPPSVHDVKVRRKRPTEYCEICPVPPDYMLVSERSTTPSLQQVDFVQYRPLVTLSYLREQGYQIDDDIADDDDMSTVEDYSRQRFGLADDRYFDSTGDPSRRIVRFKESYIRIDRDGDGIAELRKVCQVGRTLLADEETDIVPYVCGTGVLMPHQHLGISVYDLIQDLARLKTALLRQFMDNKYLANNARIAVNINADPNIDDLLTSRPGGIVRVGGAPAEALMQLETPDTGASALQALEYLDTVRENRTGYTRQTQGLSSDALSTETLGGQMLQLSQSQLRLEMIARTISETLLRDLFAVVHALTLKYSSRSEKIRMAGKWIEVDPREWVRRADMSIAVGLGSGTSEQKFSKLVTIAPFMQQAQMMGLVGPQEGYNFLTEVWKEAGYRNADRFIHEPQRDPQTGQPMTPPPQPSPQEKVAMINAQGDQAKLAQQTQLEQQKMAMDAAAKQQDQQNALALQASNDARDAQREQLNHEREMQRMALDNKFKYDQMAAQFAFDAQQKALDREANMQIEAHKANVASQNETLKANTSKEIAAQPQTQKAQHHTELLTLLKTPKRVVRQPDGSFVVSHETRH